MTYDKTKFLSGMAMGLCGKGKPTFRYIPLEYIESTGAQYIDTGVILTQNSKAEMSVSHLDPTVTGAKVFGSRSSATANNFSVVTGSVSGIMSIVVDFHNYANNRLSHELVSEEAYEISISKEKLKINTSEKDVSTYTDFATPANAYLFNASGTYPASYAPAAMRLHYCKIYDGEVLIRDYIPVKRKTDGVVGLLDKANNVFYSNAGTGGFIAGAEKQKGPTTVDFDDIFVKGYLAGAELRRKRPASQGAV